MTDPTKFFRIGVAGDTVDGRKIEASWLTQMAANYDPKTYTARVNMEHVRGITADKPFKALGDVVALKAENVDVTLNGKTEKRMALFAQIDPTADLVAMNKDGQKVFSSMEVNPTFAGSDKAYLVGLAVTDSPASLATERLTFAAKHSSNVISDALETSIEFAATTPPAETESTKLMGALTDFLKNFGKKPEPAKEEVVEPKAPPAANDNTALLAAMGEGFAKFAELQAAFAKETRASIDKVAGDLASFKTDIESADADAGTRRKKASGAGKFTSQVDF